MLMVIPYRLSEGLLMCHNSPMKGLNRLEAMGPRRPRGQEGPNRNEDEQILAGFNESQRQEIRYKQRVLSSIAYFIGKDFEIPVLLNRPGAGWHWNFKDNHIKVDPKDLLKKPLSYSRWVTAHEGGHRRISRTSFIPDDVWRQPGFAFMSNAIEDPRDNNFITEAYPALSADRDATYTLDQEFEAEMKKTKKKLGFTPRFARAGLEYIKQWFREVHGKEFEIDKTLPDDVKAVVQKTLSAAQDSWWRYPSKDEADQSEATIEAYAKRSYEINRDNIWPEYKRLVDEDMKDERTQKAIQEMQQGEGGQGQPNLPQELKDNLTPDQQKEIEGAIREALRQAQGKRSNQDEKQGGNDVVIDMDLLSPETKEKIKEYVESLPEEKRRELEEKARQAIRDIEDKLGEKLKGKLSDQVAERKQPVDTDTTSLRDPLEGFDRSSVQDQIRDILEGKRDAYDEALREVADVVNRLENDLRNIFRARKARGWEPGKKSGPRIRIQKRIQEIAKDVPAPKSRAWQRRDKPIEKDHAFTLLVDLSGSMSRGDKIRAAFQGAVALTEALNRLSIKTEILGFHDELREYRRFSAPLSDAVRENMGSMLQEVKTGHARWNDDGWALSEASKRLAQADASEKFLIPISDGLPVPSPHRRGPQYDLESVVKRIEAETDQKLIGLGLGRGTEHVRQYYPNSIANVSVEEMAEKLADLILDAIERYDEF